MDIIIEIGNDEQKELIKLELSIIEMFLDRNSDKKILDKIIVPEAFDDKVNELRKTTSYKSARERQVAVAKYINCDEGRILLFSSGLYVSDLDSQVRGLIYIHEAIHVITKEHLPEISVSSPSEWRYLTNLHISYDEYFANRLSLEFTDDFYDNKSTNFKRNINAGLRDYLKSLRDNYFYNEIRSEIKKFRSHGNVTRYLESIDRYFDQALKAVIYSFAFIDSMQKFKKAEKLILGTPFVDEKTMSLIDFFRKLYCDRDFKSINLGKQLMVDFMTNFGMRFEDDGYGEYCYVLDI